MRDIRGPAEALRAPPPAFAGQALKPARWLCPRDPHSKPQAEPLQSHTLKGWVPSARRLVGSGVKPRVASSRRHRAKFPPPAGAAPCTPSASTAPSRSATSRTAATTATIPTSRPSPRSARARRSRWRPATRSTARSRPATTVADFAALDAGAVHPLTGPVFVKGAQPGDILEIEFIDIIPQPTAFSAIMPGLGFLRDVMTEPFLVHWQITRRLGDLGAASRRAHSRRAVHGRVRRGALGGAARRMDRARAARDRPRRLRAAARCRRRGARPGPAASPACAPCRRARTAAISTSSS